MLAATLRALRFGSALTLLVFLSPIMAEGGPRAISTQPAYARLAFNEFFIVPVGPRGIEFTDKLRSLNNRRVTITGYMVEEEDPRPGRFLLAPMPQTLHDHEYGLADDLPASTLFVDLPHGLKTAPPAFRPGLLTITGILHIGNREEPDGRISWVRLELDDAPITSSQPAADASARLPVTSQPADRPSSENLSHKHKE
jgi:hypothetical protein